MRLLTEDVQVCWAHSEITTQRFETARKSSCSAQNWSCWLMNGVITMWHLPAGVTLSENDGERWLRGQTKRQNEYSLIFYNVVAALCETGFYLVIKWQKLPAICFNHHVFSFCAINQSQRKRIMVLVSAYWCLCLCAYLCVHVLGASLWSWRAGKMNVRRW